MNCGRRIIHPEVTITFSGGKTAWIESSPSFLQGTWIGGWYNPGKFLFKYNTKSFIISVLTEESSITKVITKQQDDLCKELLPMANFRLKKNGTENIVWVR